MTDINEAILSCPMDEKSTGAASVREYMCRLLTTLWEEEECFSGKRPFGNSGWQWDVYRALAEHGIIEATKVMWGDEPDEYDWDNTLSYDELDALIIGAIKSVFAG